MFLNITTPEAREVTTSELIILWLFALVFLIYLITALLLMVMPSLLSDYRKLTALMGAFCLLAVVLIVLQYFERISEYVVLAAMILYIIAYVIGALLIKQRKRAYENEAQKTIDAQRPKYNKQVEEMWVKGDLRKEERIKNFSKIEDITDKKWNDVAASIEKSWTNWEDNNKKN